MGKGPVQQNIAGSQIQGTELCSKWIPKAMESAEKLCSKYHCPELSTTLLRLVLLHWPRLLPTTDSLLLEGEVLRLFEGLQSRHCLEWDDESLRTVQLDQTYFRPVEEDEARNIQENLHYLRCSRGDSVYLGLFTRQDRLLVLYVLSPFDLHHMEHHLHCEANQVRVLSRVCVLQRGIENLVSFGIARLVSWVRCEIPSVRLLLTYCNPNLGFSGTIYKASNWLLVGQERKNGYLYLDDDYVSDRTMIKLFGSSDFCTLKALLGKRLSRSSLELEPLEIFLYPVDRHLRNSIGADIWEVFPATKA